MKLKCFYKYYNTKSEKHHYYVVHVLNDNNDYVLKKNYNIKIYTFDKVMDDIKHYTITETEYKINKLKVTKEKYLETISQLSIYICDNVHS